MVDRKLGRGLEFFLSDSAERKTKDVPGISGESVQDIELGKLVPSPFQPRTNFDPVDLQNLAASLRSSGVLQPILVRRAGSQFQIIAGERRWRAAQLAGLERIPALVREVTDESAAVLALVENVQRTDLNAIEKAKAFKQIQTLTKASQRDLARQVGLERSTVTNILRLLDLPEEVQEQVSRGTITMGHARALLGLAGADEQKALAVEIVRKRLSVRQVEVFIQALNQATEPPTEGKVRKAPVGRPVWLNEIEENLTASLGAAVSIRYGRKRSRVTIDCVGREEFERVYELLKGVGGKEE